MNTCEHYRLQISQLLDGELPEAQQQTLRAHLHTLSLIHISEPTRP